MVCRLGWGCLGPGLVLRSFSGVSLAAFPGLKGAGSWELLLWSAFFEASEAVGFLLPAENGLGVTVGGSIVLGILVPEVGGTAVAGGPGTLV